MYAKADSQYSKLVMVARKAKTETPGSGESEVRAKSAVVELDTQPKATSSESSYEAIIQQIAYLMSTITNQNASNNGQNGSRCNNGNGKFPNTKTPRSKKDQKDMLCWRSGGIGHGWRECSTPRQGNSLPFKLANRNLNSQREEETQTSSPLPNLTREESILTDNQGKLECLQGQTITIPIHGLEYWEGQMNLKLKLMG